MKIIIANYRFFIAGGPEKYMFKCMAAANKMGIEVIPFSVNNPQNAKTKYSDYFAKPRANTLMYSDTKYSFGNLVGMARATVWNYDAYHKMCKLIRDTQPDAVYILHEINHLSPSIIRAAKKEGVRVIHRISDFFMFCAKSDFLCGDEICEDCIKGSYNKAIKNRCVKGSLSGTLLRVFAMKLYANLKVFDDVDKYVTPSLFTRNKLIEGGIENHKVVHIPTFIDVSGINPCYTNKKYFLFLGRMAHQKGTIYAIKAMIALKNTEYVLKITGILSESPEDQLLKKIISDNGLENKIIFVGFKSGTELDCLISNCVCVVCPAIWYENMPNTVIEAYAYGKPVVASRLGSFSEIVDDEKTGFLFESKNIKELSKKLSKFVEDESLSAQLGHNAREKCQNEYSEKVHMSALVEVLQGKSII